VGIFRGKRAGGSATKRTFLRSDRKSESEIGGSAIFYILHSYRKTLTQPFRLGWRLKGGWSGLAVAEKASQGKGER